MKILEKECLRNIFLQGTSPTAISEKRKLRMEWLFSYVKATKTCKCLINPCPPKILESTFSIFNSLSIRQIWVIHLLMTFALINTRLKVSQELKQSAGLLWQKQANFFCWLTLSKRSDHPIRLDINHFPETGNHILI